MVNIKINSAEVKSPLAKLLVGVLALIVFLLVLALMLLVFLPIVWFSVAMVISALILLIVNGPKFLKIWRIVVIEKQDKMTDKSS